MIMISSNAGHGSRPQFKFGRVRSQVEARTWPPGEQKSVGQHPNNKIGEEVIGPTNNTKRINKTEPFRLLGTAMKTKPSSTESADTSAIGIKKRSHSRTAAFEDRAIQANSPPFEHRLWNPSSCVLAPKRPMKIVRPKDSKPKTNYWKTRFESLFDVSQDGTNP